MSRIKTRNVIKGTIKTVNKGVIVTNKARNVYRTTKNIAEEVADSDGNSAQGSTPEGCATDKINYFAESARRKGVHYANRIGEKSAYATKQNIVSSRENIHKFREKRIVERLNKHAQGIKPTAKEPKLVSKSAKTVEKSSKVAIKTTRQAVKMSEQAVIQSQRTLSTSKKTAKATASASKKIINGTIKTIKISLATLKSLITAVIAGGWVAIIIILFVVMMGAAVSIFGNQSSPQYTQVNTEVEAYTPVIQEYAKQYGVYDYVELIKAIMMQESGGKGTDPMQASESGYNTQYPHYPNGITDPNYSIEIGIKTIAGVLHEANVKDPIDMENIKLALQGYNFGNGYISWARENYGGYSMANAIEFSDMMAQNNGWDNYGDKQYVPHVLRYYPYGQALAGDNQMLVAIAKSQIGNQGGEPYWSWYGFTSRVEWCACFVSWCANEDGLIDNGSVPKFSSCVSGSEWFKDQNKWADRYHQPAPGTIIFFDWGGDGKPDHVGIVEKCENGFVYTIEGNSGDTCRDNFYRVGSDLIYGYGIVAM